MIASGIIDWTTSEINSQTSDPGLPEEPRITYGIIGKTVIQQFWDDQSGYVWDHFSNKRFRIFGISFGITYGITSQTGAPGFLDALNPRVLDSIMH